jgi:hypothetical protein
VKTIIKILLALVILTACFNAGWAAFNNFQFEDAAQQALLFESRAEDEEVVGIVMKIAAEYAVPLDESGIDVRLVGMDRVVNMTYTTDIALVPGVYSTEWTFTPRTSTRLLTTKR